MTREGEKMLRLCYPYVVAAFICYLLGCSNLALYLSMWKGVNLREGGSKNLGASNAMILMGFKAGALVALHDIGKAVVAVLLARMLFPDAMWIGTVAGAASVLGHIFPFYLKFKGGKGFAYYLGMVLALNWKYALVLFVVVILVTLVTDYIVVGTMTSIFASPIFMFWHHQTWIPAAILCIASLAVLYKHRENFTRLMNGEEIGFRRARSGSDRKI